MSPDQEWRNAVINAVNEAVELTIGDAIGQTFAWTQGPVIKQVDTSSRVPAGTRYQGNIVSLRPTTGGRQAIF